MGIAIMLLAAVLGVQPTETPWTDAPAPRQTPALEQDQATTEPKRAHAFAGIERGFGVASANDEHSLRLGFFGQLRHTTTVEQRDTAHGFRLKVARPVVQAKLWNDRVHARVMPELAGGAELLDATVTFNLHEALAIHAGQFRPYASRGIRIGLPFQAIVDRGPVVDEFRVDRDIGFAALGHPFGGRLEYYFGVMNGDGRNTTNVHDDLLYTARMVVAPLGPVPYDQTPYLSGTDRPRAAFGVNAYTRKVAAPEAAASIASRTLETAALPDRREVGLSADLVVSGGRWSGLAEGFWRHGRQQGALDSNAWGAYAQLSALVVRDRFDVGVRAGALDLDDGRGVSLPIEAGFNVYFARHHAKLQAGYTCMADRARGCATHGLVAQGQLAF